jgi:hypothetical protein
MSQSGLYSIQRPFAVQPKPMPPGRWRTLDERQRELGVADRTHTSYILSSYILMLQPILQVPTTHATAYIPRPTSLCYSLCTRSSQLILRLYNTFYSCITTISYVLTTTLLPIFYNLKYYPNDTNI